MPADHETIRIRGLTGRRTQDDFYLFREVPGGGSPGRPRADGSDVVHIVPDAKNLPAGFPQSRRPILVEQLGLARDSGGAGPGRAGLGYDKRIRALGACRPIPNADRPLPGCSGVTGGRAGGSCAVPVTDPDGRRRSSPGMCDTVTAAPGPVVRIVTTGGGRADPPAREPERVAHDERVGNVPVAAARRLHGAVLRRQGRGDRVDAAATAAPRAEMAAARGRPPMSDRGPCFGRLRAEGRVARPEGCPDPAAGRFAEPPRPGDLGA